MVRLMVRYIAAVCYLVALYVELRQWRRKEAEVWKRELLRGNFTLRSPSSISVYNFLESRCPDQYSGKLCNFRSSDLKIGQYYANLCEYSSDSQRGERLIESLLKQLRKLINNTEEQNYFRKQSL